MHFTYIVIYLIVGYISPSDGFRFPRISEYNYRERTSVEIVALNHPDSYRYRRSDDCTPDHLGVRFTANHKVVKLSLHRNYDINVNAPIFVQRNGAIVEEYVKNTENVAVFQDTESGSAMLVQCIPNKRTFELFGTFYNGSEELMMEPEINEGVEDFPVAYLDKEQNIVSGLDGEKVKKDKDEGPLEEFSISHHAVIKGKTLRPRVSDFIEKGGFRPRSHAASGHSARIKRADTAYRIELLIVADYSAYNVWLARVSTAVEAKELLRQFYAFVLNGIDLRYKSVTGSGFTITVIFAGLYIAETSSNSSWTEDKKVLNGSVYQVSSPDALNDFKTWVNNRTDLPGHDHAMLFTAYDLHRDGNSNVAGLAYVGATCTTSSQSIVEDDFDATMMTVAAHELGHSLGAQHDGTSDGTGGMCSPSQAYIMAASLSLNNIGTTNFEYNKNVWKFSSCSISYFSQYISTLNSTNCMTILGSGYNASALSPHDQEHAGQVYSADIQCRYTQGSDSYFCRTLYQGNYTNMCSAFYCNIPGNTSCALNIAAEKTTCGNGKWCVAGNCVASAEAPPANDTCPHGDQPGIVTNGLNCSQLVVQHSSNCYNYVKECCYSCQSVYTGITGCEYGDKSTWCIGKSLSICYTNEALCCGTCLPQKGNTTGCEYGDKTDCSAVSRYGCYANEVVCCGKCLPQKVTIPNCGYGDKATGCNTASCALYDSSTLSLCCETCYVAPSTTTSTAGTTISTATTATTTTPVPATSTPLTVPTTSTTTQASTTTPTTTITSPTPTSTTTSPTSTSTTTTPALNTTTTTQAPTTTPTTTTTSPTLTNTTTSPTSTSSTTTTATSTSITVTTTAAPTTVSTTTTTKPTTQASYGQTVTTVVVPITTSAAEITTICLARILQGCILFVLLIIIQY